MQRRPNSLWMWKIIPSTCMISCSLLGTMEWGMHHYHPCLFCNHQSKRIRNVSLSSTLSPFFSGIKYFQFFVENTSQHMIRCRIMRRGMHSCLFSYASHQTKRIRKVRFPSLFPLFSIFPPLFSWTSHVLWILFLTPPPLQSLALSISHSRSSTFPLFCTIVTIR